jgi:hypothetical protein
VDLDAASVVNEAQFSKFVHFRDHRFQFVFLAEVRQQQEQTLALFESVILRKGPSFLRSCVRAKSRRRK